MEQIEQISPRSKSLKKYLKVPMILLAWSTATFSSVNLVLYKSFGEILKSGEFEKTPISANCLFVFAITGGGIQLIVLNVAMKYYDNIDVMPVYQSLALVMMLLSGWVLLDEI